MSLTIAQVVGALLSITAGAVINALLSKWAQAYREARQKKELAESMEQARMDNERGNRESDRLREIDGR